ncbi:protein of unknown function [Tenacibaculum mesophilum]|uniref:DUF4263 domain-containing protein n=1 Tax=Tenacibaculum mesophilum TaxID=104268 RepID=A0ABM7CEJ5_9FLAO|nr:Shedu anti-phage system protein SduA domain-containing protein [Tenacibaculum mesophilum]AZJ32174.1 DUF4263 domain-containing protein [Tenacibaculum mesophilum]QFS27431.1 DUF4263 domain-containing protein [Tenacibaculum mesophilum]SHG18195.1 protein of unknown function [Tenacibaculum mesophilum]
MKKKDRLSKWKKEEKHPLGFESPVDSDFEEFLEKRNSRNTSEEKNPFNSNYDLMKMTRELVFDIKNGVPVFHYICPMLDTKELELSYHHLLDSVIEGDDVDIEREVINTLGLATALEVPVYPNNDKVEIELSNYYRKLIQNGFTAPDEDGNDVKIRPVNSKKMDDFKVDKLSKIDLTKFWSPTDLLMLKQVVKDEFLKLNNAHRTLTMLEIAIEQLEKLLDTSKRNENSLQKCITENPILLGLDYAKIIPKHKLGSEFEVDYALEKFNGLIDLMEIESSNLSIFTKQGNPSSYLVHAEQQVIDWLDWTEKNNAYARIGLEGLISPKGFVIIGRSSSLTEKTKASLIRRNKAFNGNITIMTYDDVLRKAKSLRDILKTEKN